LPRWYHSWSRRRRGGSRARLSRLPAGCAKPDASSSAFGGRALSARGFSPPSNLSLSRML
jgi:hypothetical protein